MFSIAKEASDIWAYFKGCYISYLLDFIFFFRDLFWCARNSSWGDLLPVLPRVAEETIQVTADTDVTEESDTEEAQDTDEEVYKQEEHISDIPSNVGVLT